MIQFSIAYFYFIIIIIVICLFRVTPAAYGGSQARGPVWAVADGLPEPQQQQIWVASATYTAAHGNAGILNPLSKARDRTWVLMDSSRICFHCTTVRTPKFACFKSGKLKLGLDRVFFLTDGL